jgi:PAS domain S-box-containing protein
MPEKYMLNQNWLYSFDRISWKSFDISKSFEKQKITTSKNKPIYLKLVLGAKEIDKIIHNYDKVGIYFGKIEGLTEIEINNEKAGFWYNETVIFFEIPKDRITRICEIKVKITRLFSEIPGGEPEIIPYMDLYDNIEISYMILYFLQILCSIIILFLGIYYSLFYSRKLRKSEFLIFLLLCFLVSVYSFLLSPVSEFIGEKLHITVSIAIVKCRFISLYVQPFIGLLFIGKILGFNSKLLNKIKITSGILTFFMYVYVIMISDLSLLIDSVLFFHIFTLFHIIIYIILSSIALYHKNYNSLYVLLGLVLFSIFSVMDIADNWKIINLANRYPVYSIGILFFIILLGVYLSRQFINMNLDMLELTKSLEIKVAERTKKIEYLTRQKTDFFANISHEFRTPLTLILGPVESILTKKYGNIINADDEKFKMMLYNGSKLLKLINNLLDFSKIDANKIMIKKQKINISQLLKFYVSLAKTYAENIGLTIIYNDNNTENKLITYTDRDLLEKSVFNLISNAMKFTPKGGQIIVQLDKKSDEYQISVKDTGIGIPADKIEYIFERFNQVDSSSSRKYEGTGIGLSLTREFVVNLGGKISVKSKLNEGSVFIISLPYVETENEDVEISIEENKIINPHIFTEMNNHSESDLSSDKIFHKGNSETILVVEDNQDMRRYLKMLLEENYDLIFAGNGIEGMKKAIDGNPDLILSDIMMPEMDGYGMTELIKADEKLKYIPVILLTAKADMDMKMEGFKKGADDYIIKPFDSKELCARVRVHIQIKKMRDDLIKRNDDLKKVLREKIDTQSLLEESEKRFREMAENIPVAIIESDSSNKIIYANRYADELMGVSENENIMDYIEPKDKDLLSSNAISMSEDIENREIMLCGFISKTGKKIKALLKSNRIFNSNGIRYTILEYEPNVNIILLPDEKFYDKYGISDREKDVINLLIKGLSYKDIGKNLFISYKTVDNHISNIYMKTKVTSRHELVKLIQKK